MTRRLRLDYNPRGYRSLAHPSEEAVLRQLAQRAIDEPGWLEGPLPIARPFPGWRTHRYWPTGDPDTQLADGLIQCDRNRDAIALKAVRTGTREPKVQVSDEPGTADVRLSSRRSA
jgi:hypothetical protein